MKSNHPKLKTPLFSPCGLFRHCAQTTLSPTTPHPPPLPLSHSTAPSMSTPLPPSPAPPPPPPPPPQQDQGRRPKNPNKPESSSSSSSSSSTSTSQSFTQWRIPLTNSSLHPTNPNPTPSVPHPKPRPDSHPLFPPSLPTPTSYQELFHLAELQLASGSDPDRLAALHMMERSLVPNPPSDPPCPTALMRAVVGSLRDEAAVKPATKILLALCLAEGNRRVAVEAGVVGTVVEVATELEGPSAERALAALELACRVAEGAEELRGHALAVPVMVTMMGKMGGRGKEYAISALAVIYGGGDGGERAPAEEVGRAVALALQKGDCSERGRRKGRQLLKALEEHSNNNNSGGGDGDGDGDGDGGGGLDDGDQGSEGRAG